MTGSRRILVLALFYDLARGEPHQRLHPVVWIGATIEAIAPLARRGDPARQFVAGALLAAGTPAVAAGGATIGLRTLRRWQGPLGGAVYHVAAAWLLTSSFAVRALFAASGMVRHALAVDDMPAARQALRALVSRDASTLGAAGIAAAAIESLAENFGDGIVAPLLAYSVAGVPGAVAYRAINTLDATIGYHGPDEWVGKAAARLDDLVNLAPARCAALLLCLAAPTRDARLAGWRLMRRDARLTASPNAGWPMAAAAGIVGVALEKQGHYRLGAGLPAPGPADIRAAERLVAHATTLAFLLAFVAGARRRRRRQP